MWFCAHSRRRAFGQGVLFEMLKSQNVYILDFSTTTCQKGLVESAAHSPFITVMNHVFVQHFRLLH